LTGLIDEIHARLGSVRIVDLGGRRDYWNLLEAGYLASRRVEVTLLNFNATQLPGSEECGFIRLTADACAVSDVADNAYDLVHSNSTIEHVGNWDRVEAFAAESRRLAPCHFVQTPYFWFPVEPHLLMPGFHFLPEGVRAKMLIANWVRHKALNPDMAYAMRTIQDARLLDRAQMRFLYPDSKLKFEWLGPFPKSIIAIRGGSR